MDNASIHFVDEIVEMIQQLGAIIIFLLPYSPYFNPIEELFSKVKKKPSSGTRETCKTMI